MNEPTGAPLMERWRPAIETARAAGAEFEAALARLNATMNTTAASIEELARALTRIARGHRRRTGHRHAGTRDHRLRFAPGRKDLPLGQRTAAKLRGG